jgi:putative transposase
MGGIVPPLFNLYYLFNYKFNHFFFEKQILFAFFRIFIYERKLIMIFSQKYILKLNDADKSIIDNLSFHSARLYNSCIYNIRQYYFDNNTYLSFKEQYYQINNNDNYKLLITDSSQQILRLVDKNFRSFFSLLRLKNKGKYSANVRIPSYLDKDKGFSILVAGRSARIKHNKIYVGLSKQFRDKYNIDKRNLIFNLPVNLHKLTKLQQLQIKPIYGGKQYELIIAYKVNNKTEKLNENNILGIDCGLDNLLTSYDVNNKSSFIVDGKPLKSINQFFNKQKSKLQSAYELNNIKNINTNKFIKLSEYRKNYINNYFNQTVNKIIKYCINNDIGTIVIGDFKGIKQKINIGKNNNQNFVSIPFGILKRKLEAKCEYYGIAYVLQEESYTSKCSALDLEKIEKKEKYKGKRIKRGMYRTENGKLINSDVNGACNIVRKYKCKSGEDLSSTDVSGVINHPVRINPTKPIGL